MINSLSSRGPIYEIGLKSDTNYKMIHPDSIAKTYLDFYDQDSSAWSWEIELRTYKERF